MLTIPQGTVYLASYPKSGNTWMRILLSNLLAETSEPEDINSLTLTSAIASARGLLEENTLLEADLLTQEEVEQLRPAALDSQSSDLGREMFLKVHDAWTTLPDGSPQLGRTARAAVYLVRDPRDVAISYAHHCNTTVDDIIQLLGKPAATTHGSSSQVHQQMGSWTEHVESWLDQPSFPVHLVRYEDLLTDTTAVFSRVVDFLGIRFSSEAERHEAIASAVRHADFSELQAQEQEKGFRERTAKNAMFFREGKAGGWRSTLTEDQTRRMEQDHHAVMERLGYARAVYDAEEITA